VGVSEHFAVIDSGVKQAYALATRARAKGIDPVSVVETPVATSLAEKSVGLISVLYPQLQNPQIIQRIIDLEKEFGPLEMAVSLKIAEEIAKEMYCSFESKLQALEAGIRVGFAYTTLGVVSSPIEGFTELRVGTTREGKEYLKAYFSGPIRSAGTTAGCVVLMIIDYLREVFGYAPYDPTEEEIRRYVTENYDYHERVNNLQYLPTEEEIAFLASHLPIQITGEPSEQREVSNYKDLARIETNLIRGGMCLIFSEGLAQKAQKGLRLLKRAQERGFVSTGWNFLDQYVALHKKREKGSTDTSPTYIKDLVAGRPVFGHPSRAGGFRFRYGLSSTNGFSATAVHPATMGITDSFISFGTQLKIEKPTKGCAVSACDSIEGPIVKMSNGSIVCVETLEEARRLYPDVSEIIYLGDLLVPFGDVANRNYELIKSGYVEEWWFLDLQKKLASLGEPLQLSDPFKVGFEEAISLSQRYSIPLYPNYTYRWTQIARDSFLGLIDWIAHGAVAEKKLVLPYTSQDKERFAVGKRALEIVGCPHQVSIEHVIISEIASKTLLLNLGIVPASFENEIERVVSLLGTPRFIEALDVLSLVNLLCPYVIKDRAGSFIGCRMGRPEKAKLRVLDGSPHVLFPVGKEGGRLRSFQAACEVGKVSSDFPVYFCSICSNETISPLCPACQVSCVRRWFCQECERFLEGPCENHKRSYDFRRKSIDIRLFFEKAKKNLGLRLEELPVAVKGVRGTSNKDHSCEPLEKGLLRAKYNLHVNKDGTIRYDMTEMPLSFFKPREVGTPVQKLISLGYTHDYLGAPLEREDQILELFPHDIVLPSCPDTLDERADSVFVNVTKFIDDELEKLYGLEKYYNVSTKYDLIGSFFVCIAPHICTATVGRLIGYSKTQSLLASPYMHAAMRRDCDGDEAAVMLLMDLLLNFSRKFLPAHRGGTQDAPLVLNTKINAGEVDDQILDFEVGPYPLELYELAEQGKHSSEVKIETVKSRLKSGKNPFDHKQFTHGCSDFNACVVNSSYKLLPSMDEKVSSMMRLCSKLRSVDVPDVARLVIERHFIRDTRGNLRKFSMQVFRCVGCNEKFRRPPLSGVCSECGGKLIFTISEGSIVKYLSTALSIAREYGVSPYLLECLEITEKDIQSIFGKEKEKQEQLRKWFA
jgi:DNA polymerase II large subunit